MAGAAGLPSCSNDDPRPATDAGDETFSGRRDTGAPPTEAGPEDAAVVKPPPPILPGCVGPSMALQVAGERAYVGIPIGAPPPPPPDAGADDAGDAGDAGDTGVPDAGPADSGTVVGDFVVDFGTSFSTIDFAAFKQQKPTPVFCYGDPLIPGADCQFQGFEFFGDWGFVWLHTADYSGIQSLVRQSGILGTDFLAFHPYTLDYTRGRLHRAEANTFCTDAQLLGAGFMPLPTDGFYTSDVSKLRPLADVITNDIDGSVTTNFTVPNIPTVPIAIAGVNALAQLDTGYDDRLIRHSINVNEALFKIIEAEQAGKQLKLERDDLSDVYLTTCVPGYSERVEAYRLTQGETFDFIASGGSVARRETTIALFVKTRTEKTAQCGGIATWTVPAAQIGASFFVDAQAMILDPKSSRVWIPKK